MTSTTAYRVAALALLLAIGAHRLIAIHRPASVQAYHDQIRQVAQERPTQIGAWIGQDVPVPVQAMTLLDPNVMISRQYINVENGLVANLLIVHCSDAHDMAGHFPLRCYPAAGWERRGAQSRDWQVGDLKITGTEYQFSRPAEIESGTGGQSIVVANCLLRPGGRILRNMDQLTASIIGAGGQSSGAAQIQVSCVASVPSEQRDQIVQTLLQGYLPVIHAILADPELVAAHESLASAGKTTKAN